MQDAVHAILVAVLPNAAAKVVHVHNERRSEAARAHCLSRHCGEHTEYVCAGCKAKRQGVVDIGDALEAKAKKGAVPWRDLNVVVGALNVDEKKLVHETERFDELGEGLHRKGPFVQEHVQKPTVVNEPKPARAPRLWFDDQWHNEPWLVSSCVPSAYVISPRRNCAHGDELANGPRVQRTYSDLMLFWPVSCVAGHTPPLRGTIEAHTVEEGAVGVCAPRQLRVCASAGRAARKLAAPRCRGQ